MEVYDSIWLDLLSLLVFGLWPVWLVIGLVWYIKKRQRDNRVPAPQASVVSTDRPAMVVESTAREAGDFIERHALVAQLAEEAEMLETIGRTERASGLRRALAIVGNVESKVVVQDPSSFAAAEVSQVTASGPTAPAQIEIDPEEQQIKNNLLLLYLGGFLFVAAIALFVLLAGLGGGAKTLLVLLTSAALYGGGMYIDRYSTKLRPAAVTFVAMGVGALPFVGLAMNRYLSIDTSVAWVSMSLLSVAAAGYAAYRLQAQVLSYLLGFTWLSLAVSATFALGEQTYIMMWVAVMAGLLLSIAGRHYRPLRPFITPFDTTAQVSALLAAFGTFFVRDAPFELWHMGVTWLLGAAVFAIQAHYMNEPNRSNYAITAHGLAIFSLVLIGFDILPDAASVGVVLAIIGLLQLAVIFSPYYRQLDSSSYQRVLIYLTAYLPLFVTLLWHKEHDWVVGGLAISIVTNILLLQRKTDEYIALPLLLSGLALPLALGWYDMPLTLNPLIIAGMYGGVAASFFAARYFSKDAYGSLIPAWRAGYLLALAGSLLWVVIQGSGRDVGIVCAVLGMIAIILSYYERQPRALLAAPFLITLAIERLFFGAFDNFSYGIALSAMMVAAVSYGSSYLYGPAEPQRREALAYSAIALTLFSAFFSIDQPLLPGIFGPTMLFAASLLSVAEIRRNRSGISGELVAWAGGVLAVQWAMSNSTDDISWLVYTHMWAAYAAVAACALHLQGKDKTNMVYLALIALTGPVAIEAIGSPESGYGLILIAEQAILAVLGVALKLPLLTKWGVAVATLAVIYMMRDFTYLNLGLIALLLIGYAIYRLNNNVRRS